MDRKYIGKRVVRNEDPRLLTGQAQFVDDVQFPGMLHAAFLRSEYAHARVLKVDVSKAREYPGVVAVFTAEDMGRDWFPGPPLVSPPPTVKDVIFHSRRQVPLVKDKVRHAGEAVAVVIAESRYIAEDAAEQIEVEYEPLEVVLDLEKALAADSPRVHDDLESNLAAQLFQKKGDYEAARKEAEVVIKRRIVIERGAAAAMENRGIVAQWDAKGRHLTVWDTTQAPIPIRNGLAARLGLSESQVRVIAPFIGGGFGPKIMMFYPEEMLIPWVAMKLNRPVKWIEDRRENFYATTQERGQVHDVEIALDRDGRILGIKDDFIHDTGAYDPYGLTIPINTQCHVMGGYDIKNFSSEFRVAFTNRIIATPVRGAGRPQGIFVIERMLDLAARELGMDAAEIRRRNLIQPHAFPYQHEIVDQAFAPLVLDSGNYPAVLDKALEMIGYEKFVKEEQPRLRKEGKYVGIAVAPFIETTGIGPYEGARVTVETSGRVNVATGIGTQGQGHFTSFAQVVAEQIGIKVSDVRVTTGDTSEFHWGTGTFASRGAVVAGNAVHAASSIVRGKILKLASKVLGAPEAELELEDGQVRIADIPQKSVSLGELAALANPLRGAVEPGTEPGLESTAYFGPQYGATAFGTHAMIVETDPETMMVKIRRYVVAEDCGTVLNPLILEGQIHGGVSMGLGNSYYEKLHYDENGQLLNASFADYLLVSSTEMPRIEVGHLETPSPLNELGTKGVGEAGAIPVPALFAQAVQNALHDRDFEILEMPLSPNGLFELLNKETE
ncbi:MAG: xanthine dehydrogenase [Chloroflexi bacterium]|nr:xanthine dehydrogenase family protein molybdopterin-binding subunit [Chloroflexi bacterium CFX1]MCK6568974.1 xanthine dehydrogenase family protein molybdopterin-binding subunit [Anaerolineales bacterium]MCQ3952350.1 xanthine dehydrogenase family protein molybdopterin-binding subunit [Chloroflexota bacterium]MDL1917829.1 xanthine dehydrogenase family protein molybdopterin-binding subunit [Chloroflexi bacterium CFX5]NUQ58039.1 xanthine dehydrogenase family protein molybdopterin-binding subunit